MRILICGLPGSGKTTLAYQLKNILKCPHHNADDIRELYDDWDFSIEGRIRQAYRMKELSDKPYPVICDFVAPTKHIRDIFGADFTIWMDTTTSSKYRDTDKIFEEVRLYDIRITHFSYNILDIGKEINDRSK